ncbi:MAG: ACT domain-containing protein [Planctomycetota bacterium]|jgi:ACT domain-containing protein
MAKKKTRQICIVTVTGKDKVGIIARISNIMAKVNVNIVDVSQRIMEEYFVMTMACDITDATAGMDKLHQRLGKLGKEMDLRWTCKSPSSTKIFSRPCTESKRSTRQH